MSKQPQHDPSCMDDYDPQSLSIDQARQLINQAIHPINDRLRLSVRDALGFVLSDNVCSRIHVPSHNNSAMDGYAIHSNDLPQKEGKTFQLIGTAYAGIPFNQTCQQGQTVRIMTGAMLPDGCDTVIMQEHVERPSADEVLIGSGHHPGQNVRLAGEDIKTGETALHAGKRVTPADMGVIASLGIGEVNVYRKPRVAFFSTGDELRSLGDTLDKGQIYDSNRYTLYGMLKRLEVDIIDMGVIPDNPEQIRAALSSASNHSDVIITSGGVSVGEADYIKDVLEEIGDMGFWKIAMKPGRPLTFGKIQSAYFFGLPGNPVSAMVTFYQFVQTAIQKLAHQPLQTPLTFKARCLSELRKRPGRFEFQRGIYEQHDDGLFTVKATGQQGSGILTSMSSANCFILLNTDSEGAKPDDTVLIQPFDTLI